MILRALVGFGIGGAAQAFTCNFLIYFISQLNWESLRIIFLFLKYLLSFHPKMIALEPQLSWVFSGQLVPV